MQEIHKNLFWSATNPPSHQKSTTKVIWLNVRWWPIYHGQKLIYQISKKKHYPTKLYAVQHINQGLLSMRLRIQQHHRYACQHIKGALESVANCIPWRQKIWWRMDEQKWNSKILCTSIERYEFAKLTIPLFCLSVHRECAGNGHSTTSHEDKD